MFLPADINTIIAIVIIIVIIVVYYMYYFLKDMMRDEIKDFYIKTEKTKLKNKKKDIIESNIDLNQPFDMEDNIYDMEINEEVNNIEIESFIDPIKKNNDQNQVLSDRIFNI